MYDEAKYIMTEFLTDNLAHLFFEIKNVKANVDIVKIETSNFLSYSLSARMYFLFKDLIPLIDYFSKFI